MKRSVAMSPSTGQKMAMQKGENGRKFAHLHLDDKENIPGFSNITTYEPMKQLVEEVVPPKHPLTSLVVEVEGNLGSGKSTLLKKLRDVMNKKVGDEEFCSVFGEIINDDFLGAFYSAPKEYGFAFQMYMLTTRLYQIEESARQAKEEGKVAFLDRGAVGDTLFALLSNQNGNMSDKDMGIYRSVCRQRMPATLSDKVDVLMYLDVDPHECHRRVTTVRNNEAEEGLPLAYLDSVDNCYFHLLMDWIGDRKGGYHEMNIGAPPKTVIVRWNNFGTTEGAIKILEEAVENKRRPPSIEFVTTMPATGTKKNYMDEKSIEEGFKALQEQDKEGKTCQEDSRVLKERLAEEVVTIYVNWALQHTNPFRRMVMYHLSLGRHVVFYNDDQETKMRTSM